MIDLKDEDIGISYNGSNIDEDKWLIEIGKGIKVKSLVLQSPITKKEAEQLKKQILENQEIVQKVREEVEYNYMSDRAYDILKRNLKEILGEKI